MGRIGEIFSYPRYHSLSGAVDFILTSRGIGLDDIAIGLHPALSSNDTTYGRAIIDTGVSPALQSCSHPNTQIHALLCSARLRIAENPPEAIHQHV